jgi:SnoaL-like domain
VAAGASGDLAYTLGYEHVVFSIDGGPVAPLTLRVTHLYRREDGEWKTIHRHADAPQPPAACWCARAIVASTLTFQVISPAASARGCRAVTICAHAPARSHRRNSAYTARREP